MKSSLFPIDPRVFLSTITPILDWGAAIESLYFNQYLNLTLSKFTITPTIMFKTLQQIKENNSCENFVVSDISHIHIYVSHF